MLYQNLSLPTNSSRPFLFSSFVATADGKTYVNKKDYWPIGSRTDYESFTRLRAHADAIIDGKQTAIRFAKNMIETLHSESFQQLRSSIGKKGIAQYVILTKHPDEELTTILKNPYSYIPIITGNDIQDVVADLYKNGAQHIFIDGGPHVLASFFKAHLIDELFLTIAPRIFGNRENAAITMVEGILLEPNEVTLELVLMERVENEVFLRYKILYH